MYGGNFLSLIDLYLIKNSNSEAKSISHIQQSIIETIPRVANFNIKSYLNSLLLKFQLYQKPLN